MTVSDYLQKRSPKKRKANKLQEAEDGEGSDDSNDEEMESGTDYSVSVLMQFEQLTRELEVKVYTGLPSTETFKFLSGYLSKKAQSCNIGEVESRQLKNHLNPLLLSR